MNFVDCVKGRRSIRKFKQDKINHETFEKVVELASCSPSWKNSQIVRYTLVEDESLKSKLANECIMGFEFNKNTMENAPAVVVVSMIKNRCGYERDGSFTTSKEDRWEMFDAGIACQTFALSAYENGLGCVILGIFDEAKVSQAVGLPDDQKVACLMALGYPDQAPEMPKRKDVDALVSYK